MGFSISVCLSVWCVLYVHYLCHTQRGVQRAIKKLVAYDCMRHQHRCLRHGLLLPLPCPVQPCPVLAPPTSSMTATSTSWSTSAISTVHAVCRAPGCGRSSWPVTMLQGTLSAVRRSATSHASRRRGPQYTPLRARFRASRAACVLPEAAQQVGRGHAWQQEGSSSRQAGRRVWGTLGSWAVGQATRQLLNTFWGLKP